MPESPPEFLHYIFHCSCAKPIALPVETLGPLVVPQESCTTETRVVALVCPHCSRVRSYSVDKESASYDPTHRVESLPHKAVWKLAAWLSCGEETCGVRLLLFLPRNIPTDAAAQQRELATWIWTENLKCPKEHSIPQPILRAERFASVKCQHCQEISAYPRGAIRFGKPFDCINPECNRRFIVTTADIVDWGG